MGRVIQHPAIFSQSLLPPSLKSYGATGTAPTRMNRAGIRNRTQAAAQSEVMSASVADGPGSEFGSLCPAVFSVE